MTVVQAFTRLLRLGIGGLLIAAAVQKLFWGAGSNAPAETIYGAWSRYPTIRYGIPLIEMILGLALLVRFCPREAAIMLLCLLSIFSAVLVLEFRHDKPRPCGCMNAASIEKLLSVRQSLALGLIRNTILISGAAWIFVHSCPSQQVLNKENEEMQ